MLFLTLNFSVLISDICELKIGVLLTTAFMEVFSARTEKVFCTSNCINLTTEI